MYVRLLNAMVHWRGWTSLRERSPIRGIWNEDRGSKINDNLELKRYAGSHISGWRVIHVVTEKKNFAGTQLLLYSMRPFIRALWFRMVRVSPARQVSLAFIKI